MEGGSIFKMTLLDTDQYHDYVPVVVKHGLKKNWRYVYSLSAIDNIIHLTDLSINTKRMSDRVNYFKELIDLYIADQLSIVQFHIGLVSIYGDYVPEREIDVRHVGKKRMLVYERLPEYELTNNDSLLADAWYGLTERGKSSEWHRNPSLSNIRMLFSPDLYSQFDDTCDPADWVEPISSELRGKVNTYTKVNIPMRIESHNGFAVGPLELRHESEGLKHYVNSEPIHRGSIIQVHFGKGWIWGRYDWPYDKDQPASFYSGHDRLLIEEGQVVRMKLND